MDRWAFLAGRACISYPCAPTPNEASRRGITRKMGTGLKEPHWPSYYSQPIDLPASSTLGGGGGAFIAHPSDGFVSTAAKFTPLYDDRLSSPDQATLSAMKKLSVELRAFGKELDVHLSNNKLTTDEYTMLKQEQKVGRIEIAAIVYGRNENILGALVALQHIVHVHFEECGRNTRIVPRQAAYKRAWRASNYVDKPNVNGADNERQHVER